MGEAQEGCSVVGVTHTHPHLPPFPCRRCSRCPPHPPQSAVLPPALTNTRPHLLPFLSQALLKVPSLQDAERPGVEFVDTPYDEEGAEEGEAGLVGAHSLRVFTSSEPALGWRHGFLTLD